SQPAPAASRGRGDFVPETARQQPSRPASRGSSESGFSGGLDPAFNAGLTGSGNDILQPVVGARTESEDAAAEPGITYTVVAGDSLSRIAREYGVTINAIKSANNLSSNTIRVGQELVVP